MIRNVGSPAKVFLVWIAGGLLSLFGSGISAGWGDHGLCGIGFSPSALQSAPVNTATTPGDFSAADASILSIVACAWGERTKKA